MHDSHGVDSSMPDVSAFADMASYLACDLLMMHACMHEKVVVLPGLLQLARLLFVQTEIEVRALESGASQDISGQVCSASMLIGSAVGEACVISPLKTCSQSIVICPAIPHCLQNAYEYDLSSMFPINLSGSVAFWSTWLLCPSLLYIMQVMMTRREARWRTQTEIAGGNSSSKQDDYQGKLALQDTKRMFFKLGPSDLRFFQ